VPARRTVYLRHPTVAGCDARLAEQAQVEPTDLGVDPSTLETAPPGYRLDRDAIDLGAGQEVFERARECLGRWAAHLGSGLRLHPERPEIVEGRDVLISIRVGPVHVVAACRTVAVVDELRRFGFAYATLPLHPERGRQAFFVEHGDDDVVRFVVSTVSRPRAWWARASAPLTRAVQRRAAKKYVSAVSECVAPTDGRGRDGVR